MNLDLRNIERVELPEDFWGFRFKKEGVTIKINTVAFNEQEDGTCVMKVGYDIMDGQLTSDKEEFEHTVGDLVVSLIEEKVWYDEGLKRLRAKENTDTDGSRR